MITRATVVAVAATLITVTAVSASQEGGKPKPTTPGKASPPIINPLPPFPTPPDGPRWHPAPRLEYRVNLEQFRLKLEAYREVNPTANMREYRSGLEQYRDGIKLYRGNGMRNSNASK